jgi:hypothetical protein
MGLDAVEHINPFSFINPLLKYNVFGLIDVLKEAISVLTNL